MSRPSTSLQYNVPTLLVAVQAPYNRTAHIQSYYDEFINLVKTSETPYEDIIYIKLREIDSAHFLTKGQLDKVAEACKKHDIEHIIISEPLSPQQERNLEDELQVKVFDRTQLILDIFEKSAHSAEGKTQVEIARLQFKKTRLAGKGIFLEQQKGVVGLRAGSGETMKEKEVRYLNDRIATLRKHLKKIETTRETQRKQRLERNVTTLALIGYTNAGKSSILNALTKSNVLAEDKLFATLDTTTRELYIDSQKIGVISDTVGFIQQLPHRLIEAFKSTLSELQYADLLLHVVDISDPKWQEHINVVLEVLQEIDVDKPMLYVFNKVDKIDLNEDLEVMLQRYEPHVITTTTTKDGMGELKAYLKNWKLKRS
jgi:GTP-binding protein HflX